jgi:serine/threonine protein kinase
MLAGMEPQAFGDYQLLGRFATGGMAELWIARRVLLGGVERRVVIKRVHPDKRGDDEYETMFLDEARLMSRLSHPHVAQVYDAGHVGGEPFLALEHIEGASLRDLVAAAATTPNGVVSEMEALSIALTVAETLDYVHDAVDERGRAMRIVHRDLTPDNVLVSYDGAVKLIDFGIAQGENRVYQTTNGVLKGTCGYMAPEQLIETADVDRRTDIFAFGVILYELTTGVHPFTAKQAVQLFDQVLGSRYRRPREVRPDLSDSLETLIVACLSRQPSARPATMREVAESVRDELVRRGALPLAFEIGALVRLLAPPPETRDAPVAARAEPGEWVTRIDPGPAKS